MSHTRSTEVRTADIASAGHAFYAAIGVQGNSKTDSEPCLIDLTALNGIQRIYVAAPGRDLTVADSARAIISSTSAGNTAMFLPNMTTDVTLSGITHPKLVYTRDPTNPVELSFTLQRTGTGPLFLNTDDSTVTIYRNGIVLENLPIGHPPVTCTMMGTNIWFLH